MEEHQFSLHLPTLDGESERISCGRSLILIGANGSGKTRLGTWIELESPEQNIVHRISAQKSLSMPDTSTPTSIELAENELIWGNSEHKNNKSAFKWNRKPATSLLNDFDKLMVYLFSDETERNAEYKNNAKNTDDRLEPPTTKMDMVKVVWEKILPHRELIVGGLRIQTALKNSSSAPYNASEMSDGERVIFYLIGQSLSAPRNGIVLIDEPELHIHKSIQSSLWMEVEKLREDCLFIYLTHDTDFASTKIDAKKIWLKSFDGKSWDWEVIEEDENMPETLLLEVLGSRKPVVFVEGKNDSSDVSLYREIFPEYLVIPLGGCESVIRSTKAMQSNSQLHHLDVFGVVDRDRRTQEEIAALESSDIHVLDVAEVENLFCCEEVLALVSQRLSRKVATDFHTVKSYVIQRLKAELDHQISLHVSCEIKHKLSKFEESGNGVDNISEELAALYDDIDVQTLYEKRKSEFSEAIENEDYSSILKMYNRKKLSSQVSVALGLAKGELAALVVRMAKTGQRTEIRDALKSYFGGLSDKIV